MTTQNNRPPRAAEWLLESCAPADLTFEDLYPAELTTIRLDADKEMYRAGFRKAGLID